MLTVCGVMVNSPSHRAGIRKGDVILSVNGNPFNDILDLIYAESEENLNLIIQDREPVNIIKKAYEPLGLVFDESIDITPRRCNNKCLFCFVDQLPKGMRKTLYVKDDDYRMSFATGSYITLTNLQEDDLKRIVRYKLSPLYISVHAYDNEIRKKLVGNPKTEKMFDIIKRLAKSGITMHAQIVMCPDINDGAVLQETLNELFKLYPAISTVAVVPVGLTGHREKLYEIRPVGEADALKAINITEYINAKALGKAERGFCWCSDEMYLKAGKEIPPYEYYGDFMQIENGVGLVSEFLDTVTFSRKGKGGEYHLVTGESFYPILSEVAAKLQASSGVRLIVHKIVNNYFGKAITVAGLITGRDLIEQLKGKVVDKHLIIPSVMLKEFEDVFLDGISVKDIEDTLKVKITIARDDFEEIICGELNV